MAISAQMTNLLCDDTYARAPELSNSARAHSYLSIGEISLSLTALSSEHLQLDHILAAFVTPPACPNIEIDIDVTVRWADRLHTGSGPKVFTSGGLWTLFRDDGEFSFDFISPLFGIHPYKRLRMDPAFGAGEMTLNREALERYRPVFPLEYPADELLITNYLACRGLGVEVHGCGLIDGETGYLFLGHSGAGKSTTTRLWKSLRNPEILSDDRIILRLHDDELWMYGTPWHGEAAFASSGKAKLNRIFVLQHGVENKIVQMSKPRATAELFARCFPPFHSASGLERTVEFLERVVDAVPCYEFHFIPDASAIETVLGFRDFRVS